MHPAALQTQAVAAQLTAVQFDVDAYDLAWQDYLTCGGFPRAVSEHARSGAVSGAYLRDIEAWLRADIDPDAPAESIPNLLAGLASRSTSPLNATATARDLGYATRDIFERRMSRLVTSFAVLACPQRDERGRSVYGAQSKWYLTDPILSWLPSRLRAGLPEPDMTRLTESTIAVALARAVDGSKRDDGRRPTPSATCGPARVAKSTWRQ